MLRFLTISFLLLGLSHAPLGFSQQKCASTTTGETCALTAVKTTITKNLLELDNCNSASLENVLDDGKYPITGTGTTKAFDPRFARSAPVDFLRGVCRFHQEKNGSKPLSDYQNTADFFQKAATTGLMNPQKSAAALFEGLSHCRAANFLQDKLDLLMDSRESIKSHNETRNVFCLHRTMAKEAFSEVNWTGFSLQYEASSRASSVDELIGEMSSCGENILKSDYDTVCGEITAPDSKAILQLASCAAASVLPNYVTILNDDGKSHHAADEVAKDCATDTDARAPDGKIKPMPRFTAMMAHKLMMVRQSLAQSETDFSDLRTKADALSTTFEKMKGAVGVISPEVTTLQKNYVEAAAKAQSLLELTDQWAKGLYTDENQTDVRVFLKDRQYQLAMQKEFLEKDGSGLIKQITDITQKIASLAGGREATNSKIFKSMCAFYYCEMANRSATTLTKVCTDTVVGSERFGNLNSLCPMNKNNNPNVAMLKLDNGVQVPLAEACQREGFKPNIANANQCMTDNQFSAADLGVTL